MKEEKEEGAMKVIQTYIKYVDNLII